MEIFLWKWVRPIKNERYSDYALMRLVDGYFTVKRRDKEPPDTVFIQWRGEM